MKIKLDLHGVVLEYERKPMHPARFRRLCVLAVCGMYVALVFGVASTCGIFGVAVVGVVTFLCMMGASCF